MFGVDQLNNTLCHKGLDTERPRVITESESDNSHRRRAPMQTRCRRPFRGFLVALATIATLLIPAGASTEEEEGCWFEDWDELDLWPNPDDPYHMGDNGASPETQDPGGEWHFVDNVFRGGTHHPDLLEQHTGPSGEHPSGSCTGGN
jgi:hypothetical protein